MKRSKRNNSNTRRSERGWDEIWQKRKGREKEVKPSTEGQKGGREGSEYTRRDKKGSK